MTIRAAAHLVWSLLVCGCALVAFALVSHATRSSPGDCNGIGFSCSLHGADAAGFVVVPATVIALLLGNAVIAVIGAVTSRRTPTAVDASRSACRLATRVAVAALMPFDDRERADQRATLEWIDSGARLWRTAPPATPPEHLVAYCVLVDVDARSLLLVDHRKAGLWLPNGGHIDSDEHPRDAAKRELQEELGLRAPLQDQHAVFITRTTTIGIDGGHVDISLWYAFRGTVGMALRPDPDEFSDHRWFPFDDITSAGRFDPELPRFVAKLESTL